MNEEKERLFCYQLKILADSLIEQQEKGQICPELLNELAKISLLGKISK